MSEIAYTNAINRTIWNITSAQTEAELYPLVDRLRRHVEKLPKNLHPSHMLIKTKLIRNYVWAEGLFFALANLCDCAVTGYGYEIIKTRPCIMKGREFLEICGREDRLDYAIKATEAFVASVRRINGRLQKKSTATNHEKTYYQSGLALQLTRRIEALMKDATPPPEREITPRKLFTRESYDKIDNAAYLGVVNGDRVYYNTDALAKTLFAAARFDETEWKALLPGERARKPRSIFRAMAKEVAKEVAYLFG